MESRERVGRCLLFNIGYRKILKEREREKEAQRCQNIHERERERGGMR